MEVYWLAQNGGDVPLQEDWLSPSERCVLSRLAVAKRRADWQLGRWTAKLAIAAYHRLSLRPEVLARIEVRAADSGAPEAFLENRRAPFPISLSHSGGVGFCAIGAGGTAIGCDVESVAPRSRGFIEDYFTAEEQEMVWRSPAAGRDFLSTLIWSAKESALKAMHCGLRADTRTVTASPRGLGRRADTEWQALTVRETGGISYDGWWRDDRGCTWTVVTGRQSSEIQRGSEI